MGPFFGIAHSSASRPGWSSGCGGRCCCWSPSTASIGWPGAGHRDPDEPAGRRGGLRAGPRIVSGSARSRSRRGRWRSPRGCCSRWCAARGRGPSAGPPGCPGSLCSASAGSTPRPPGSLSSCRCGGWSRRAPGPRLRRLWLWWVAAVIGATFWWLIPLALLGGYSPPFLDWIESAAVTTSVASPINALRGVTQWVAYLPGAWPAGSSLVTSPLLVLQSGLLAALGCRGPGLASAAGAHVPGRCCVGRDAAADDLAHRGGGSPLAPTLQTALDHGLAPLRNVHKFDPVLRLPLALGLAHLLGSARIRPLRDLPITRYAIQAVAVLAVLSMGVPFLANRVAPPGSFTQIPGYWTDAADWLHEHASGRTLVLPGAPHSTSYWGVTSDEPMQVVARGDWAVRDAVPLSSAGNIRLLDSIEQLLASGTGGAGLAELLADAGISDVLVRHDIVWARTGSTRPTVVDAALQSAPGLTPGQDLRAAAGLRDRGSGHHRPGARPGAARPRGLRRDPARWRSPPGGTSRGFLGGRWPGGPAQAADQRSPARRPERSCKPTRRRALRGPPTSSPTATESARWPSGGSATTRPRRPWRRTTRTSLRARSTTTGRYLPTAVRPWSATPASPGSPHRPRVPRVWLRCSAAVVTPRGAPWTATSRPRGGRAASAMRWASGSRSACRTRSPPPAYGSGLAAGSARVLQVRVDVSGGQRSGHSAGSRPARLARTAAAPHRRRAQRADACGSR